MFMYSDYSQHLLDHVKKIHFIGCGGSGMYPLIQILAAKGYEPVSYTHLRAHET